MTRYVGHVLVSRPPRSDPRRALWHGRTISSRRYASVNDASATYDISPKTVRRRIADGSLTAYRLGPKLPRIDLAELDQLLRPVTVGGERRGPDAA